MFPSTSERTNHSPILSTTFKQTHCCSCSPITTSNLRETFSAPNRPSDRSCLIVLVNLNSISFFSITTMRLPCSICRRWWGCFKPLTGWRSYWELSKRIILKSWPILKAWEESLFLLPSKFQRQTSKKSYLHITSTSIGKIQLSKSQILFSI